MTEAHTPERWEADDCRVFMGDGGISLHKVPNGIERARLIAAAPDLLEALRLALPYVEDASDSASPADQDFIRAAIAKATATEQGERG